MATFFQILRAGLWQTPLPQTTADEAKEALREAKRQTVVGIVFDALSANNVLVDSETVLKYYGMVTQIEQQNAIVNAELCHLASLMQQGGVSYVVVKGQVVGSYYGKSSFRQAGDIDFYCDNMNFDKAKSLIEREWQCAYEATENSNHEAFHHHGVEFEQHSQLLRFYSKLTDRYWNSLLENDSEHYAVVDGQRVRTLSPTLHVLYIFLHLYKHLMGLGIGLRQFCDMAMILHACKNDIDHETLRRHLKVLGMERAYRACGCILVKKLGLPAEEFTYATDDWDWRYAKKILDVVMYRGNMGKYNKKGGAQGALHNMEATGIKFAHFFKFMPLAPTYSCRWIVNEMKRKIKNRL